jgi:hypothetical protein
VHCTSQHHAIAVEFDLSHLAVRTGIACRESDWQSIRVEPHGAARPGRQGPAGFHLTPRIAPPDFFVRYVQTLP